MTEEQAQKIIELLEAIQAKLEDLQGGIWSSHSELSAIRKATTATANRLAPP